MMATNLVCPVPPTLNLFNDNENPFPDNDCDYFDLHALQDILKQYDGNYFSVFSMNLRSCRKNFPSMLSYLNVLCHKFTILILVETWLTADCDYTFNIPGFNQINIYKSNFGGGIKVFYHCQLDVEIINDLTIVNEIMQVLSFNIKGPNYSYTVVAVYKPPSSNNHVFNEMFFNSVIDKIPQNSKIVIAGDFNLNLLNPFRLTHIDDFISNMLSFGYFP